LSQRVEKEQIAVLAQQELGVALEALQFALRELGPEEFFTITGYEFDFGEATIRILEERRHS
jgi:hypothetical protein